MSSFDPFFIRSSSSTDMGYEESIYRKVSIPSSSGHLLQPEILSSIERLMGGFDPFFIRSSSSTITAHQQCWSIREFRSLLHQVIFFNNQTRSRNTCQGKFRSLLHQVIFFNFLHVVPKPIHGFGFDPFFIRSSSSTTNISVFEDTLYGFRSLLHQVIFFNGPTETACATRRCFDPFFIRSSSSTCLTSRR